MADKGFFIDDILLDGVRLNIPSGLWRKSQLIRDQIIHSKKI